LVFVLAIHEKMERFTQKDTKNPSYPHTHAHTKTMERREEQYEKGEAFCG